MDRNLRYLGIGGGFRALGLSLASPFFSLYLRNVLHIDYATIALASIAVSIPPLLIVAFGGLLADRLGRRRLLLLAIAGESASMFGVSAFMLAGSFVGVVVGVGVLSLAGTAGGPALSAYVADLSLSSDRTRAYTWLRVGHNAGFAAGVFTGGALIGSLGFVPVVLLAAGVTVVGLVFLASTLAPSPYDLALRAGAADPATPSEFVRPGTIRQSLRILARDRLFLAFCIVAALAEVTTVQWGFVMPLFVHQNLHLSYSILGAGFALNGLLVVFGQGLTTRLLIGHRHTTAAALGSVLYIGAFLLLGLAGTLSVAPVLVFFVFVVIATVGENVFTVPLQTLPSNLAVPGEVGSYNGAFATLSGIGPMAGILLGGLVLSAVASPFLIWVVLVAPAVPATLAFLAVGRRIARDPNRV
ncbi:MAG: MFS transporter [Thermoplasmata archaeon]|nr:MFS transporter [Thermoplasmata archaeon]